MSEEILINGKKITELSDMFFEYCKLKSEIERLKEEKDGMQIVINNYIEHTTKYRQAFEEIRKEANRLLYEENPIYGYNNSNYFEILAKYVLAKTDEVLNDRD